MKTIRLITLTLDRFKGIEHLSLDFGGRSAALYGANGLGKSTVYDGWLWLITGKDSSGMAPDDTKGFQIKPLDSEGNVADRSAHSAVEAVVELDGERATLRKEYYERWTRRRGAPEASYDGNTTDYYINDVPRSKREYEGWIEERMPLRVFHLLSHTGAFAALSDADRRAVLFEMADIGNERDLMAQEERFEALLDATGTISLYEYQHQQLARRKAWNKERDDLPARLDEVRRTMADLRGIPFDQLRQSVEDLEARQEEMQRQISDAQDGSITRLQTEASSLNAELTMLEAENRTYRAKQVLARPNIDAVRRELLGLKNLLKDNNDRMRMEERDKIRCENEIDACTAQWRAIKSEQYPGTATCPTCGQPLPKDRQDEARQQWEAERQRRLDAVIERGSRYRASANAYEERYDRSREKGNELATRIGEMTAELEQMEQAPAEEITDMPDYEARRADLKARIEANELAQQEAVITVQERQAPLVEKRRALMDELTELRKQLAKEGALQHARTREAELVQRQRDISAKLEEADRALDLVDEFTRYKASYVTDTINALFRRVTFRLFRQQVNGGLVDCCDILVDGVPYDRGLNTGARVTAGLDMIEALSRHYGASAPVFVDGAESVTDLIPQPGGQMIRLVVSESDRKLRFTI